MCVAAVRIAYFVSTGVVDPGICSEKRDFYCDYLFAGEVSFLRTAYHKEGHMFILNITILTAGFFALIKGADIFVDGSAALARNFRVPALIIGLTIVALGTSAPEFAVSVSAALQGSNEIALSNVVGSNMFNLLCVLGTCALISPVSVDKGILKRDFPIAIASTVFVFIAAGGAGFFRGNMQEMGMEERVGSVSRIAGLILITACIAYIGFLIFQAKRSPENEEVRERIPVWKCVLLILLGLFFIVGGGKAVVYSAKEIARAAGMTETLIGLTIVAVGTSLPELVTSVVAAGKGQTELAVGNVAGSNIFNLMFILGVSAALNPVTVNAASVYDMLILILTSMLIFLFSLTARKISRVEGGIMLAVYAAYVVFAVLR